jgi:transcriptional regulator with XRE-family HTH domain
MNVNYIIITFVIIEFTDMKDRILEFLRSENKSSAQFADEIGVQPSGISHILSGRNNPSLDFILKMLDKYKFISTDWLLFGRGPMYKDSPGMRSLFDEPATSVKDETQAPVETAVKVVDVKVQDDKPGVISEKKQVEKIVWFYKDSTFREFYPES